MFRKEIFNQLKNIVVAYRWPIVLALLLRVGWVLFAWLQNDAAGLEQFDSKIYTYIANSYSETGVMGFLSPNGQEVIPIHNRVPGYPFLISMLGVWGVVVLQLLASIASIILMVGIGKTLHLTDKFIKLSVWFFVLDVPSIVFSGSLMTESLFAFLVLMAIWLLRKSHNLSRVIVAGVLLGLACYLRPVGLLLGVMVGLSLLVLYRKQWGSALLLMAVSFLTISPWIIRNKSTFNRTFFSTVGTTNLHQYRAAGILAEKNAISLFKAQELMRESMMQESHKSGVSKQASIELVEIIREQAIDTILSNKMLFVKQSAHGLVRLMGYPMRAPIDYQLGWAPQNSNLFKNSSVSTSVPSWVLVTFQSLILLALYTGILLLFVGWKNVPKLTWILLVIVCYLAFLSAGVESDARFRIPFLPILAILSGFGYQKFSERRYIRTKE